MLTSLPKMLKDLANYELQKVRLQHYLVGKNPIEMKGKTNLS